MDNFRWILLAVGIVFVVIVYLISRKNKRDFYQEDDYSSEDLPDINTSNWDDLEEGVGEVRIVARNQDEAVDVVDTQDQDLYEHEVGDALMAAESRSGSRDEYDSLSRAWPQSEAVAEPVAEAVAEVETVAEVELEHEQPAPPPRELSETVLVLNILARDGSSLSGKSINSVAHANNLVFGDMNIYHRLDDNEQPLFSMVNMVKPGSFDPATIHEITTPGVSLFMQLPGPSHAEAAFDDMLNTAQRMSEALEARLCDRSRQPMTESTEKDYRNSAAAFDAIS